MTQTQTALPPTLNMHIVGHCNFRCRYCYARFEKAKTFLPIDDARRILEAMPRHGVNRVTFAGGEPTLHPELETMLRLCAEQRLVTALVTNASFDREAARRIFPWLRWLVLSVDSHQRTTNEELGRRRKGADGPGQVARIEAVVGWLREWNSHRAPEQQVRLKLNIVVSALNVHEDPAPWLRELRPERVKLLQCSIVPGENDDARDLMVSAEDFARYCARVRPLREHGIVVVGESTEDLLDSYAMVDPAGRFRQSRPGGYVLSERIAEVGVENAWQQVGGCDLTKFDHRGGHYDPGAPSLANAPVIVALEGLDSVGKSTTVRALAERLKAPIVTNPPERLRAERASADGAPLAERRAWYRQANKAAMADAADHVFAGRSVVMDRCFASTAVYAAAERGRVANFTDVPRDMPRPDFVFLLSLDEATRQERQRRRNAERTSEESRLDSDAAFRERVLAGYAALGAKVIDVSGPVANVVEQIVTALQNRSCT